MDKSPSSPRPFSAPRYALTLLAVLLAWTGLYVSIQPLATWLTFDLLSLTPGGAPGLALEFFLYDSAKILLLLVLMVYCIGWLRAGLHVERVRDYLSGKGRGIGYLLGATFGAITPFCSCSSIPLFLGFTMARIPLGITMAFLITSPLINEIAVVLLWGLLGWKFTVVYVVVGMAAGMLGGWLLDLLRAERWLQPFLRGMLGVSGQAARDERNTRLGLEERHRFAWDEMTGIFRRVWRWVIIGVGLGALLHGFVPQDWFAAHLGQGQWWSVPVAVLVGIPLYSNVTGVVPIMESLLLKGLPVGTTLAFCMSTVAAHLGQGQWWSVPVAVLVGIPLYSNVTGVVPIMESLLLKGLPVGTTLAFCMSTVAASLPEMLMLKQVMRWQLLALFLGLLLVIFTLVGWLFNSLQLTLF